MRQFGASDAENLKERWMAFARPRRHDDVGAALVDELLDAPMERRSVEYRVRLTGAIRW